MECGPESVVMKVRMMAVSVVDHAGILQVSYLHASCQADLYSCGYRLLGDGVVSALCMQRWESQSGRTACLRGGDGVCWGSAACAFVSGGAGCCADGNARAACMLCCAAMARAEWRWPSLRSSTPLQHLLDSLEPCDRLSCPAQDAVPFHGRRDTGRDDSCCRMWKAHATMKTPWVAPTRPSAWDDVSVRASKTLALWVTPTHAQPQHPAPCAAHPSPGEP